MLRRRDKKPPVRPISPGAMDRQSELATRDTTPGEIGASAECLRIIAPPTWMTVFHRTPSHRNAPLDITRGALYACYAYDAPPG